MSSTVSSSQWCNTGYKSESTEQLDKLLAGLDKLSETLPDLTSGAGAGGRQSGGVQGHRSDRSGGKVPGGWQPAKESAPGSVNNSVVSSRAVTVRGGMRSYEDDLDYALEKDDLVIKGPERRVLLGTDNYSDHYSSDSKSTMDTQHQPYHTRNDSKPFSYIR